jgi:23S rRNA pseudouridine1911/1915/1917 synthase
MPAAAMRPPGVAPLAAAPEPLPLDILFEDEQLLVVNKPSGMLVHPSVRERTGTLMNGLLHHAPQAEAIRLPHRLDRDTSGLMVVTKTARAVHSIALQFLHRTVEKHYTALVSGIVAQDEQLIDAPIGRDRLARPQWGVREEGRAAQSRVNVLQRFADRTLLSLTPITGRTNQLRIHCLHIGHPIFGDVLYSGPPAPRLCLHAELLAFHHPITNERLRFERASDFPLL